MWRPPGVCAQFRVPRAAPDGSVQRAGETVVATHAHFPQFAFDRPNMGHAKVHRAELFDQFRDMQESGVLVRRQGFQLGFVGG